MKLKMSVEISHAYLYALPVDLKHIQWQILHIAQSDNTLFISGRDVQMYFQG